MSPTLSSGNILLAKKDTSIVYYADIVIADVEFEKTERIIKRVVAMEGDKVSIIDGKLFINNLEMDKYHCHGENKEFIVEKNNIFVLGDNADDSTDSREFGTISLKDVIAVVDNKWLISWNSQVSYRG